jgi:hypothetical protein
LQATASNDEGISFLYFPYYIFHFPFFLYSIFCFCKPPVARGTDSHAYHNIKKVLKNC